MCKTETTFSPNFTQEYCAPLSCFSELAGYDCSRPYFGSLVFRSRSFSDLNEPSYYDFLMDKLKPLLATVLKVPVDKVCLVSPMTNEYDYLVLKIAFVPLGEAYFDRTGILTIGHVLNNHDFFSPYGPYYFNDLSYSFPGDCKLHFYTSTFKIWFICS